MIDLQWNHSPISTNSIFNKILNNKKKPKPNNQPPLNFLNRKPNFKKMLKPILLILILITTTFAIHCYVGTSTSSDEWPSSDDETDCSSSFDACIKTYTRAGSEVISGSCGTGTSNYPAGECTDETDGGVVKITCVCEDDLCNSASGIIGMGVLGVGLVLG